MTLKMPKSRTVELLPIGKLASRTGLSITAIRFYEAEGLVSARRNAGGQRRFCRGDIRRLSFVKISQGLGFSLADIRQALAKLPDGRTPTKRDWESLSREFAKSIDERIDALSQLRETLTGCIGCGCLSLAKCRLYNPNDLAAQYGAGPRYLMGDRSDDSPC
jgi:MerR family redox-sensitive transcriptional activator SoxR